jgi:hypothetical protein
MERWREKKLRDEYLLALYKKQKAANYACSQSNKDLCDELGIEVITATAQTISYFVRLAWLDEQDTIIRIGGMVMI